MSVSVQALPSLQSAPLALAGLLHAPVVGLQVPAVWHWSEAVHTTGFVPTQAPARQVSLSVQALPSLQGAPLALAGLLHAPVVGLQVPAVWHWSEAVHTTGFVPTQAPAWQVSLCVHALPSLQGAPSDLTGLLQVPVAGLQVPAAWHWSEGVHTSGSAPTQAPPRQVSVRVQALPSWQAMPSTGKPARQIPVRPSQVSVPLHGLPSSQSGSALQQPGMPTAHVAASTGDRAVTARAVRAMARRTPNTTRDYRRHLGRPHEISPCASAARALPCGAVAERRRSELGTPTLRVSLTSLLLAALVATAGLPAPAQADAPWLASASPRARKVRPRVRERH